MAIKLESIKSDKEMATAEAIKQLSVVKEQIRDIKKQESFLVAIIQRAMGQEEELVDGDDNTLCTWKYSDRTSYDTKKLEEDYPEIAGLYKEVKRIRTFRVAV